MVGLSALDGLHSSFLPFLGVSRSVSGVPAFTQPQYRRGGIGAAPEYSLPSGSVRGIRLV